MEYIGTVTLSCNSHGKITAHICASDPLALAYTWQKGGFYGYRLNSGIYGYIARFGYENHEVVLEVGKDENRITSLWRLY